MLCHNRFREFRLENANTFALAHSVNAIKGGTKRTLGSLAGNLRTIEPFAGQLVFVQLFLTNENGGVVRKISEHVHKAHKGFCVLAPRLAKIALCCAFLVKRRGNH